MAIKKKLKSSLKKFGTVLNMVTLFMLVLGLQMIFSSTCYALTSSNQMNEEIALALFDSIYDNLVYVDTSYPTDTQNTFNLFKNNVNITNFVNDWNNNIDTSYYPYFEQIIVILQGQNIFLVQNNNTIGDNLPHFSLEYYMKDGANYIYRDYYVNDNKGFTSGYFTRISWNDNGSYTWNTPILMNIVNARVYAINQQVKAKTQAVIDSDPDRIYIPCVIGFVNNSILFNTSYVTDNYAPRQGNFYWNTNIIDYNFNPVVPDEPSGDSPVEPSGDVGGSGTITNPSGDVTGSIDLSGIENSLNNIENKIPTSGEISNILSGETGKIIGTLTDNPDLSNTNITSGDITDALDFDFATDPYANFWLELTNGLKNALLGTKRTIDISFQNRTWTINLDDFAVLPAWLVIIITPFSTVFFVWILVRWWKVILDKITSGNVDSILKENSEERNFQFILKGV